MDLIDQNSANHVLNNFHKLSKNESSIEMKLICKNGRFEKLRSWSVWLENDAHIKNKSQRICVTKFTLLYEITTNMWICLQFNIHIKHFIHFQNIQQIIIFIRSFSKLLFSQLFHTLDGTGVFAVNPICF